MHFCGYFCLPDIFSLITFSLIPYPVTFSLKGAPDFPLKFVLGLYFFLTFGTTKNCLEYCHLFLLYLIKKGPISKHFGLVQVNNESNLNTRRAEFCLQPVYTLWCGCTRTYILKFLNCILLGKDIVSVS